jgi:nitronate monooxygenase
MAVARDVHEFGAHWAGQGAALIRDGLTTAELVQVLVQEWQATA